MVFRCYTEKRPGFDLEAKLLEKELKNILSISSLDSLRILNQYDCQGLDQASYKRVKQAVFSEPQTDFSYDEEAPQLRGLWLLAIEALPGQYDQRADSCSQCIQMLLGGERVLVKTAKLYAFKGELSQEDKDKIKGHLINPVESREVLSMEKPSCLEEQHAEPQEVSAVDGFIDADDKGLENIISNYGLAMDIDDLRFMRDWFRDNEKRNPSETELRVTDTYWSDHCRHTTFSTHIDDSKIEDTEVREAFEDYLQLRREVYGDKAESRPQTLMDMATIGAKVLKKRGLLDNLDESKEVNACSINISATIDGEKQDWLLMFKNETHNHPTEIEPFGGAATCVGGAIRDPLSGRSFVYQAMRITGAADPRTPLSETIPGKLPQRRITTTAADGYSSYGNQIGVATGLVREIYHPGYAAKRMELGAVVGAAPAENVIRLEPSAGDVVILIGGRTGRDGIGGATGSSKAQNISSVTESAAEVQKGNAPEERKIQRLFRKSQVTKLIKRCNDFGAGGVCVAIGELADGLSINLDNVRKKYEGLSGTELAISESQERMAVVVEAKDADKFIAEATEESLEAYIVAQVTESPRMVMSHNGKIIADLSREFLNSNGAEKHINVEIPKLGEYSGPEFKGSPIEKLKSMASDLRFSSQQGLNERFDSSIGIGSVLIPFGGKTQKTPAQVMAALIPSELGESSTCSVMSYSFDPYHSSANTYHAAKNAVVTSVAKLVAAGCDPDEAYLSFQEYFEKLGRDPQKWGKPMSALLGALQAQVELGAAAIGGKDSMSGSFMELHVPPTLVSFAIAPCEAKDVLSPEFKSPDSYVCLFPGDECISNIKDNWKIFRDSCKSEDVLSAWAVTEGGPIEGIFKMALGNEIGFETSGDISSNSLFSLSFGGIVAECKKHIPGTILLGRTTSNKKITIGNESIGLSELLDIHEATLEPIFPLRTENNGKAESFSFNKPHGLTRVQSFAKPSAVIPVFPGTNCEYDTARAIQRAGGVAETVIIRNLSSQMLSESIERLAAAIDKSQMIIIPGGFSGGDEPDGSAKFITSFFRNKRVADSTMNLIKNRDGLILGICNGFQALVKLGLIPFGEIRDMDESCPTVTYNEIGRHQAKYINLRVSSNASPWLELCRVGDVYTVPVSHGEGKFSANPDVLESMIKSGQIATQYADRSGNASMDVMYNPNGSVMAIEGALSPDGRVFGKMGHIERQGENVAINIYGNKHQPVFESGVNYFK